MVRRGPNIEGATTQSRSPTTDDIGSFLRATVTYTDSFGSGKSALVVTVNRVEGRTVANTAPSFRDQDENENEDSRTYVDVTRSVGENTEVGGNVGKPVSASDADNDVLIYSLGNTPDLEDGDGTKRFTIDSGSGQIKVGKKLGGDIADSADESEAEDVASTSLTPAEPALPTTGDDADADEANNSRYVLRVRATDPSGAAVVTNVIVTVTELPEAPEFSETVPATLWVTENGRALRTARTADAGNLLSGITPKPLCG